jgi:hypothetical protein
MKTIMIVIVTVIVILIIWKAPMEKTEELTAVNKKKRFHLNEQAKQICLNVYNNLLKQKETDSEARATSETVLKQAERLTGIPYPTMVKLSRERIVKRKRRFDAGKSRELNPARTQSTKNTKEMKFQR